MTALVIRHLDADADLWSLAYAVALRLVAFLNPHKTGRHRMWKKSCVQYLVRKDWKECSRWS
ncbi:hypothetical protein [Phytomonospora endophytica]|uniref:Uncharacterized protein n=1 Tax=Phytomonospora endophytica TaxID=714109 RepID=A0A841FD39_9ACTN|nr:hypothetical protein [Phytomonospora endophytica]MBB6032923.1 hypothetical protein [Phytomonospora endophytica]